MAIWSVVPLPFLNPDCTSGSSWFMYCSGRDKWFLSITLLACERNTILQYFEHSLALPILGFGMKTDLLQSYGHCYVFQICWHIESSTSTVSSFRIWNISAEIPLAFFSVILPKVPFSSHSRMFGSRRVTTPLWLSRSLRPFLYSS